jgi:hypothetical protein
MNLQFRINQERTMKWKMATYLMHLILRSLNLTHPRLRVLHHHHGMVMQMYQTEEPVLKK